MQDFSWVKNDQLWDFKGKKKEQTEDNSAKSRTKDYGWEKSCRVDWLLVIPFRTERGLEIAAKCSDSFSLQGDCKAAVSSKYTFLGNKRIAILLKLADAFNETKFTYFLF